MADLEHLLLEAAGRTGNGGGRNRNSRPSSRRRGGGGEGSYSDGGSDSRDEDSDDDDHGYPSSRKKPSGSQVPLKKRMDAAEKDDDDEQNSQGEEEEPGYDDDRRKSDHDSDESDVGSDLYKDEDDRRHLEQMSELEREMILTERADKKGDKNLTERIRSKREKTTTKETPPPVTLASSRGVRSSARSADRSAAQNDALNEIRAKRLRQQEPEAHRMKLREASSGGPTPAKRKRFTSATSLSSSSQSDDSESGSRSDNEESAGMGDSDDERESGAPSYEDIREITIRRSKLAKWLMEPWFDELIVGCFVRVGIGKSRSGPIYRLCLVRNIDAADPDRPYKLENKTTYKYLNVVWGNESSAARWQMAMVSDSLPTEEEYKLWKKEVERTNGRMPSKQDILEKKEAIKKSNTYVYSAATVKQMLQEKKSASTRPLNVAAEKDRLRREMEVAAGRNDSAEVERIKARIRELEASRLAQEVDKKAVKLAEMNRKNKVENFRNASELKPMKAGLKAGEDGYDPFSRRWTRSRNYYTGQNAAAAAAAAIDAAAAAEGGGTSGVVEAAVKGEAVTAAALQAAAGAGKLVDTSAPVDQGTVSNALHDFELPISLEALQRFGGAKGVENGYMARKQRIEAMIGCQVPENDGRRHALTLTVSDYKRRRGLL